ncbi:tyrosine-type recombinase/integrase [Bacteroides thetaiotaomicron]|jgi:integrase|uniref:site-specific integrase n=1 Tax=Bacteroides thetaiotaomicron TaxID=818 RepID=UPI001926B46F|nr:site-specific integrase [Bacteroides thetaiotaomicron]MBL3919079.1 site-specific integrase [Bacteroides thetaiotaomicron]MBL3941517.1 site-specific integrase [Bacteroides thetaiotaomicron]MBL3946307.1 site-specific integrase [Bacteroides thetaiotaomicron]MBL3958071.1 site-specific integrase [Bacteroides thetaiotaomicron]MCE8779524.1 site-specific integrase [Bacteroides thetaiotaomicron]
MERKKTFNVLFWLRKGRTNESLSPLFCRITIMGQRYEIPTNCHISPASWSATAQKSLGKTSVDKETNRYIEDLKLQIEETCNKLRQKEYPLNIENFKLMFQAEDNEYSTLKTLFEYHMIMEGKKLSQSTRYQYGVTLKYLLSYVRIKHKVADYDINIIDTAFVNEFFAYLQGYLRQDNMKRCNINGALKHMERFKKAMEMAFNNEWITRNPVKSLKAHKEKVDINELDEEAVKQMTAVVLPPNLAIVRDLFIFAVYTGISYEDMTRLTQKNIAVGIDKSLWLHYKRAKTGVRVSLPLLEPALEIINKYEIYYKSKNAHPLFPYVSNQIMNRYLKKIAKLAGVDNRVTYHVARHTFATTITLQREIPLETVSKMLGHTKITTTQIYARVVDTKVMRDMAALKSMYASKTEESPNKAVNE